MDKLLFIILNDTYILSNCGVSTGVGGDICSWIYVLETPLCSGFIKSIKLVLIESFYTLQAGFSSATDCLTFGFDRLNPFTKILNDKPDCSSFVDEELATPGDTGYCDLTNATCFVTSL